METLIKIGFTICIITLWVMIVGIVINSLKLLAICVAVLVGLVLIAVTSVVINMWMK